MSEEKKSASYIAAGLIILLMIVTSGSHFGTAISLPDATLAGFFLAGFYVRSILFLPVLLLLSGGIDYGNITYGGASDWCVTPTYIMLFPAYSLLWFGGRWCAQKSEQGAKKWMFCIFSLLVTTTIAFHMTSGSFYFFSGRYTDPTWAEYGLRSLKYYPPYIGYAFLYCAFAAFLHVILNRFQYRQNTVEQKK